MIHFTICFELVALGDTITETCRMSYTTCWNRGFQIKLPCETADKAINTLYVAS